MAFTLCVWVYSTVNVTIRNAFVLWQLQRIPYISVALEKNVFFSILIFYWVSFTNNRRRNTTSINVTVKRYKVTIYWSKFPILYSHTYLLVINPDSTSYKHNVTRYNLLDITQRTFDIFVEWHGMFFLLICMKKRFR